jgi:hypothetical protein
MHRTPLKESMLSNTQHHRCVPLDAVRDLEGEPIAPVSVTFLDFHDTGFVVVTTIPGDQDRMLFLYGPFPDEPAAVDFGRQRIEGINPWTVAPLGRPRAPGEASGR